MISNSKCGLYWESKIHEAEENLALEEWFLNICDALQKPILYLWQNSDSVIIGRNQNAFMECNMDYICEVGIQIIRRLTGGGAVYHDMGNINYSFIIPKYDYNREKTFQVIIDALSNLGISADKNGRNDICVHGRKISGNAYYSNDNAVLHHGTILYKVNKGRMLNVLSVSDAKLSKNGIKSIRARVGDIKSDYPDVLITDICKEIKNGFCKLFGIELLDQELIDKNAVNDLVKKYRSYEWNIGKIHDFELKKSYYVCGELICLSMKIAGERLIEIEISTDSMKCELVERIKKEINTYLKNNIICHVNQLEVFLKKNEKNLSEFNISKALIDLFSNKNR